MTHDSTLTDQSFLLILPSTSEPNRQCHCTQQVLHEVLLSTYENSFGRPTVMTSFRYIPVRNMFDIFALPGCPAALIWLVSVVSGEQILMTGRIRCPRNVGKKVNCTAQQPRRAPRRKPEISYKNIQNWSAVVYSVCELMLPMQRSVWLELCWNLTLGLL